MVRNADHIPPQIQAQLLALGIPPARQVPEYLASLFPSDFNIDAAGLSPEDLARVIIYLVGKKLISLPGATTHPSVKSVKPGWHSCRFYRDYDHLLEIVAPYVAEGLRNHEGCLWVVSGIVSRGAVCDALAEHLDDVESYFDSGQLEVMPHPSWYLDRSGRLKSFEEIAGALIAKQDQALARGFKFLRAAGDTGWVSGAEQSKAFIDYEMKVNAAIGATKVAAVCTYRAGVTADELLNIVHAHRDALYEVAA